MRYWGDKKKCRKRSKDKLTIQRIFACAKKLNLLHYFPLRIVTSLWKNLGKKEQKTLGILLRGNKLEETVGVGSSGCFILLQKFVHKGYPSLKNNTVWK